MIYQVDPTSHLECFFLQIDANSFRMLDLAMKEIQNGKERDADDWEQVFKATDSRFHFQGVQQPPQSTLALISAVWEG